MELTKELGTIFIETTQELKGYASRIFKAKVVKVLGKGGQRRAEEELGWNRGTIRKGMAELEGNFAYLDNFRARGRKPTEYHLLNLLDDIKAIADAVSQTDPTFQTTQLYIRLSAAEVRQQLIEQKDYSDEELPGEDTIGHKLNQLDYSLKKVKKITKKVPFVINIFFNWGSTNIA